MQNSSSLNYSSLVSNPTNEPCYYWLVNRIEPINDNLHFVRTVKSIQYFRIFWDALIPDILFEIETFQDLYEKYTNALRNEWHRYNFLIVVNDDDKKNSPNKRNKDIQYKLQSDLTRTIGKHRKLHNLAKDNSIHVDSVMQWFAQMFVYIDQNMLNYMQGFCDLLLPIFHIFFQGLLAVNDSTDFVVTDSTKYIADEFPEIDQNSYDFIALKAAACSVYAFQGLMKTNLNFIEQFPPTSKINDSMTILTIRLKQNHNFPSFITQIENSPSKFAVRWFLLLFTQDLKLQDTIELWFELLKPHGIFDAPTFQEKVIKVCECASIINYKIYLNEKTCSFIETMQNGSNLNFNELKATALSIKISQ